MMNEIEKYLEAIKKRALGYEYEEVVTLIEETESGTKKKIMRTKKHMPPDITAARLLLKSSKNNKMSFKEMESEIRGVKESGNSKDKN